ncbi:MAG: type II toxin-antitoxin system VapC family toxin [Bryobacteraceae bacterium]
MIAYLDTHVAVWLYAGLIERISRAAKQRIEECDLLLSPMALLELQYLYERKRITVDAGEAYGYLNATFGIALCGLPFAAVALAAAQARWTSDPFDRIIVGQAQANHEASLITADSEIRRHYAGAVW